MPPRELIRDGKGEGVNKREEPARNYADLHEHLARLDAAGQLYRIDAPVNKDTELHPLVRWQFRGGIAEKDRKAFLFTNVVDSKGRRYDLPVAVGVFAANREIYRIGMNVERLDEIGRPGRAPSPIPLCCDVARAPVHDIVVTASFDPRLDSLPIPISTPGFDAAPYLTMTGVITRDPDSGIQNMGTYRGHLKGATRLGMMMLANVRAGGLDHWKKHDKAKTRMPIAIVLGAPPLVAFQGPQKLRPDLDELSVAGGLAGEPIHVVKAKTVDLLVPAEAEIVIEATVDPASGARRAVQRSHGYVALEDYNFSLSTSPRSRAAKDAVPTPSSAQVTPSESRW
jgi:4-hydroxy-3-polyprenylbenzoate decarboxylase